MAIPEFTAPPAAYDNLRRGPVDWLIAWVTNPSPHDVRNVSRAVPMFLSAGRQQIQTTDTVSLEEVARASLVNEHLPAGTRKVNLYRSGTLAAAVEMTKGVVRVAVVIDDRGEVLEKTEQAWLSWLELSNALVLRDWPTVITTTSLVTPAATDFVDVAQPRLVGDWADAYEAASAGEERDLIAALASKEGLAAPVVGAEGPDGIPLDVCWPDLKLAVAFAHLSPRDRADLVAAGWQLVEPSPDLVVAALTDAPSRTDGAA